MVLGLYFSLYKFSLFSLYSKNLTQTCWNSERIYSKTIIQQSLIKCSLLVFPSIFCKKIHNFIATRDGSTLILFSVYKGCSKEGIDLCDDKLHIFKHWGSYLLSFFYYLYAVSCAFLTAFRIDYYVLFESYCDCSFRGNFYYGFYLFIDSWMQEKRVY